MDTSYPRGHCVIVAYQEEALLHGGTGVPSNKWNPFKIPEVHM